MAKGELSLVQCVLGRLAWEWCTNGKLSTVGPASCGVLAILLVSRWPQGLATLLDVVYQRSWLVCLDHVSQYRAEVSTANETNICWDRCRSGSLEEMIIPGLDVKKLAGVFSDGCNYI
jgi:hypothetical protein